MMMTMEPPCPEAPKLRILALDLMSKVGWACRSKDGGVMYGTKDFAPKGLEGGGMRWLRFRNWLADLCDEVNPEAIYFEEVIGFPRKNMGRDLKVFAGFAAHLSEFCEQRGIPYSGVGVGTIKKFIAGKGNASKDDVIFEVKRLGYIPGDDNQADAIAILLYVESANS